MSQNTYLSTNTRLKRHIIHFSVLLIILLTAFFIAASFIQEKVYLSLTSDNAILLKNSEIKSSNLDFSYHLKKRGDNIKTVFVADIKKADIDKLGEDYITIFTPNMQCEAFELFINDKSIAVVGDIVEYNSSIWTKNYIYTVESSLFDKETSELKVIQYSRYMSGGLGNPFIIDGYKSSISLKNYKAFDIRQGIFGISIFAFFLVILMIFLFPEKRKKYFIILFTMISMMIGYVEYFEISHLNFDFFIFKKIIVSSNLIAAGMGTLFYRNIFKKKKHNTLYIILYIAIIIIPAIFAKDMIAYKSSYTVLTFLTIPLMGYWIYISIKNIKKYSRSKIMLAFAATSAVYILVWNISEVLHAAYMDAGTVVTMLSFMIVSLALIFIDMYKLQLSLVNTNKKYSTAYKKSIIDSHTNLYNLNYVKEMVSIREAPFTFVVYDIDDFKNINDTLGHIAGDEALIHISAIVSGLLREYDVLGRYGGDEFILLLPSESDDAINSILERIRSEVEKTPFIYDDIEYTTTISLGYYVVCENEEFKSMLKKADTALYQAKKQGKNKIVGYNSMQQQKLISNSFKLIK